jgi:hypothetical protein
MWRVARAAMDCVDQELEGMGRRRIHVGKIILVSGLVGWWFGGGSLEGGS